MATIIVVWLLAIAGSSEQNPPKNVWEAQYQSRSAEEMAAQFENPSRPVYRHRTDIVKLLDLRPGQRVAEIGAGSGFLSRLIAAAVGPSGRAIATELDQKMVDYMNVRAKQEGLDNFVAQLGAIDSASLDPASVDVVLVVNTFSFFDKPSEMIKSISNAIRSGGLLVVVDFPRSGGEGIDPHLVSDLAGRAGLTRLDQTTPVPGHYALRFRKGS